MNKIEINVPQGFQIDIEKSDLSKGLIEFKPMEEKKLTYDDIAKSLLFNKNGYYLDVNGNVSIGNGLPFKTSYAHPNNATSKEQLECLMAYNKLRNVAEYLNKKNIKCEYYIYCAKFENSIRIAYNSSTYTSSVLFASKELAEKAISILGEEEIKKALFIY